MAQNEVADNKLLTTYGASQYLNVSGSTLIRWRAKGIGPAYIKLSRKLIRYKLEDLDAYISEHRRRVPK